MFRSKEKKIQKYIDERNANGTLTPFDELLCDYLSGKLKEILMEFDVKKVDIHIDWLPDYQCIAVQGIHSRNVLDLQIESTEFSIGYDPDEPDDHNYYPLESREQLYSVLKQILGFKMDTLCFRSSFPIK